jgi:hypothetical protein
MIAMINVITVLTSCCNASQIELAGLQQERDEAAAKAEAGAAALEQLEAAQAVAAEADARVEEARTWAQSATEVTMAN